MASSLLSTTTLDFQSSGSTQAKITASADTLTLEGTSSGTCILAGLSTPTANGHAATKAYVDSIAQGIIWKDSVRAATTAAGTLTTDFENGDVIDGVTLATGDRILIKNQATASENGIYVVAASGAPSRSTDFSSGTEVAGSSVFVEEGTNNADSGWVCTSDGGSDVVGTHDIDFVQFTSTGDVTAGSALTKSGNTLDVAVDDSSIEIAADALQVKALGITNDMLAGSIANAKLTNSSVTVTAGDGLQTGGEVALGATVTIDVDGTVVRTTGAQSVAGVKTFSNEPVFSAGIQVADSQSISVGDGDDLTIAHDTSNSLVTSATGDFVVDNTNSTGSSIFRLGSNSSATDFQVQNDSESALFTIAGSGSVSMGGAFTAGSLTDGTATISSGAVSGVTTLTMSGDLTSAGTVFEETSVFTSNNGGNIVYTAAQMIGGIIRRDPNGASRTDFSATAANIVAAINNAAVGSSFEFTITNTADAAESITLTTNTGITIVGSAVIEQNASQVYTVVVTNATASTEAVTIYNTSGSSSVTAGDGVTVTGGQVAVDSTVVRTSGAQSVAGVKTFSDEPVFSAGIQVADSQSISVGDGDDLTIAHDATNTLVTSATGDFTIDNTNATGSSIMMLGTDTSATDFQVQNDSASALFTVDGSGAITAAGITSVTDTTQSTNTSTGCLVLAGGLGVAKDVYVAGDHNAQSYTSTSDITLKTNINRLADPLNKVKEIEGYEYNWIAEPSGPKMFGVMAQQLEDIGLGDFVSTNSQGYKGVNYNNLIPLLIEAVKDLSTQVESLQNQ